MNERILVVDDEKAIADPVGIYLQKKALAYRSPIAGRCCQGNLEQEFDLALLDVMLPDIDGFELLRNDPFQPYLSRDHADGARCPARQRSRAFRLARTITWSSRFARLNSSRACTLSSAATPATVAVHSSGRVADHSARRLGDQPRCSFRDSGSVHRFASRPPSIQSCCIWSSIAAAWWPWRACSARCGTRTLCLAPTIR